MTPAASAALNDWRFAAMRAGSGSTPFFHPAYCAVASPAASVGQKPTRRSTISFQISGVPPSPCSIVSTPASIARRMPSGVDACATTGRPRALGDFDDALQFVEREGRSRLAVRTGAIVGVDLDEVGAAPHLLARDARDFVEPARLLCALRHRPLRREAFRAIAAGRDHRRTGDDHPRPGNDAFVDRALEADVRIAGAFGAEIAHGGDAGHQRSFRVHDPTRHAIRERLARDLIVPRRLVVRMQQQMRVALDEARHAASSRAA